MTAQSIRRAGALLLATLGTITGGQAQQTDPVAAEIEALSQRIEKETRTDPIWAQLKPTATTVLGQAKDALAANRRWMALERLAVARGAMLAALSVGDRPAEARKSVAGFEAEWKRTGATLGAALQMPRPDGLSTLPAAATRALAEAAALQVKVNYDASLEYGRATDADSGLYYLGAAEAQHQFVTFARGLRSSGPSAPVLRSFAPDMHALERELLSLYRPPASIERHPDFIAASAALKEARELDAAGLRYGALLRYLQAVQRVSLLQPRTDRAIDEWRSRLDAATAALATEAARDHSLARVFLERAAFELAKPAPDANALATAGVVIDQVLPAYRAALGPAPAAPSTATSAEVTVRLVRWPYT